MKKFEFRRDRNAVSPGALGASVLCATLLLLLLLTSGCAREQPWNVLVVTFDTTRADFLGCYGKESARTPHVDSLAADGFQFMDALASIPITLPSHSTLFTGTYPLVHGVRDNGLFRLPEQSQTLAETLQAHGYATGAAIGGFPLTREFGIDQGFDFFDDKIKPSADELEGLPGQALNLFFDERSASKVNDAILPWLRDNIEKPFFTWIHYWDPHHPHIPPAPFDQLYRHDLYQGEIAYADQNLGVILDELKKSGVYDRTLIVITADHGEGRGEHEEDTHSLLTYDSTLHVPLIIKVPGRAGGRQIEGRVGTVQVLATVLELLGLETPEIVQGRSMVAQMDTQPEPTESTVAQPAERAIFYAETLSPRLSHGWGEIRTLYDGPLKYIYGPRPELYDVEQDPLELRDLSAERPEDRERMERQLATFIRREASDLAASAAHEADDEALNRLAALGYISGGGDTSGSVNEVLLKDGVPPQDRVADNSMSSRMKQAIDRGDFLEARDDGLRLIKKDPGNAYYRRLLVVAYLGLGQIGEAASVVDESDVTPQNHMIFMQVATEIFSAGGRQRGLDLAQRVVEEQQHPLSYYLLAEMFATLRNASKYREFLEVSLDLDPSFPRSRLSLGILESQLGNADRAGEILSELVEDFPFEPRYHFNLAVFLLSQEQGDKAFEHLRRANEIAPQYWPAQLARLTLEIEGGMTDEARSTYEFIDGNCLHAPTKQRAAALIETL